MRIPQIPPPFNQLTRTLVGNEKFAAILEAQREHGTASVYYHWDDLRYRAAPRGFSREEWWLSIKLQRVNTRRSIPLADKKGRPFAFVMPDMVTELLHQIDRNGGTLIEIPEAVTNPAERDRYLVRSLMEEAIHQADVIRRSLIELHDYVARKSRETQACMTMLERLPDLNHRQQALLAHAVRHPRASYSIAGHMSRQGIVYDTARLDLVDLARRGLLDQRKVGRAMAFIAPADLEKRLRQER